MAISSMLIFTSSQLVADGYNVVVTSRLLRVVTKTERSSESRSSETPAAVSMVFCASSMAFEIASFSTVRVSTFAFRTWSASVVVVVVVVSSVDVVLKPLVSDSIEAVDAERQRQSNKDRKS